MHLLASAAGGLAPPLAAETTTTVVALGVARDLKSATAPMRSTVPTEVPPYFSTISAM